MPPWGRPPGGRGGVGRFMEEAEDVYRFQELDSDDERNGVMVDPGYQKISNGKHFNPDELYFNDMDLRAWERRTGPIEGFGYDEDYGYLEDEGYYDETNGLTVSTAEYEEFLFQSALEKIRHARATGEPDVQLTPEELDIYRSRLLRPRAPAARPQAATARPVSVPGASITNSAVANASSSTAVSGSGGTRSSKSKQRTSIFAPRPKKEKPSGRKRAPSSASASTNQPPGFVVPGPNGQPVYAPINAYTGRMARDSAMRPSGSPTRPDSRSASMSSRQAQTPPRITPPRDIPGAFPSGSPTRYYRDPTPPRQVRPPSSSSRQSSAPDLADAPLPPNTRSRSSSVQQPVKLNLSPITDYQHFTAEPYQYHSSASSQQSPQASSSHPQYSRRVVSGPADGNYMAMPRRVPVPVQRATAPMSNAQGSQSDPILGHRGSGLRPEVSDEDDGAGGIVVDVIPQADEKGYKVRSTGKGGESSGSGRDSERRRRSGRSRRKN